MELTKATLIYGSRFLKVRLPPKLATRLRKDYSHLQKWRAIRPLMDYWREQPEVKQMGTFEQRIVGFSLTDPAWACVEVNLLDEVADEIIVLLKLKFDLSETRHIHTGNDFWSF